MMPTPALHSPDSASTRPRWRLSAGLLLLAAIGLGPVDGRAQARPVAVPDAAPSVRYEAADAGGVISIRVDDGTPISVRQQGRDVFVSFAKVTPALDAADLQRRASTWIDGVSVGYDSLLLRLARGVRARAEPNGSLLTLRFEINPDTHADTHADTNADTNADPDTSGERAPPTPQTEALTGATRLELLRAQLLLRDRALSQARERFVALRSALPGQPEPVSGLAGVESQAGRWRRSLALYREATGLVPDGADSTDLTAASLAIERAQADRASLLLEQRRSRGGEFDAPVTVKVAEARLSRRIDEALRLHLDADVAELHTESVRRASGALTAFSGQRQRAVLSVQHDAMSGAETAASLFMGSGSAGLGLLRRQPDDHGVTRLVAETGRANWDYVEGLVDGALRDRLALGRTQRLAADWGGRIELGANHYHRHDEGTLGRSTSLAAELRLDSLAGVPGLAATYAVDAEYIQRRTTRSTPSGEVYAPLPLVDREVHSASLGYARSRGNRWADGALTFDGYAGLARDRYGRSGVIAGATLTYARGAVEWQLRGSQVRNVGRSRGTTEAAGASVAILY